MFEYYSCKPFQINPISNSKTWYCKPSVMMSHICSSVFLSFELSNLYQFYTSFLSPHTFPSITQTRSIRIEQKISEIFHLDVSETWADYFPLSDGKNRLDTHSTHKPLDCLENNTHTRVGCGPGPDRRPAILRCCPLTRHEPPALLALAWPMVVGCASSTNEQWLPGASNSPLTATWVFRTRNQLY